MYIINLVLRCFIDHHVSFGKHNIIEMNSIEKA